LGTGLNVIRLSTTLLSGGTDCHAGIKEAYVIHKKHVWESPVLIVCYVIHCEKQPAIAFRNRGSAAADKKSEVS